LETPAGTEEIQPPLPPSPARARPWLPPLAIVLLVLAFFSPFLLQGKVFLAADTLYEYYPWKADAPPGFSAHNTLITDPVNQNYSFLHLFNRQLKQGQFTLWSPYLLGGIPVFSGRSYPPTLFFHRFFSTATAMTLMLMTHLLLMGLFMYLYLKEIGAGNRGAVFGAAAYMFNGCAMVWLSFETVIPTSAYLPLLLFVMERFQTPRRYFFAFLGAFVLGLVFLVGHIQYILYVGLVMVFYSGFLLLRAALRRAPLAEMGAIAACCAVTALGGVLVGAIELLPNWEVINYSSRVSRSFDFNGLFSVLGRVPYRWLVTLVFPDYFGSPPMRFNLFPAAAAEYQNYNELCYYLGIPTLFAMVALAVKPRTAHARFFLVLTVVTTAMLAGSVLFYPLFTFYPGLAKLNPTRMIFIFVFAAAAAAGLGIRNIEEASGKMRWVLTGSSLALMATVAILALASSSRGAIGFFNREQVGLANAAPPWVFEKLSSLRSLASPVIAKQLVIALLAGVLVSLWAWLGKKRWSVAFAVLLTGLLGYDLITFGWGYNTLVEQKEVFPSTPSIEFLRRQTGPFRVVSDTGHGLYVNALQPFGIQEIGGYASVYPERVNKLMSAIEYGPSALIGMRFDRWVMFSNVQHPLFDLLNVRYVLTAPNSPLPPNLKFKLVFAGDLLVYENLAVFPRAFAVHRPVQFVDAESIISYMNSGQFNPSREVVLEEAQPAAMVAAAAAATAPSRVDVTSYDNDRIDLTAAMSAPGWVVLSDSFFPGWKAEIDGQPARILRADCALRAVAVPGGSHKILFTYRPSALSTGRALCAVGLLLCCAGMVLTRKKTRIFRTS
jgi:hypothetical protein